MLDCLLASLRVVAPMAITIALGVLIRRLHIVERDAAGTMDTLAFRVFMPAMIFIDVYDVDFSAGFHWGMAAYSVLGMAVTFLLALLLLKKMPDRKKAASLGQALARPSYIVPAVAVGEILYGRGNIGVIALLSAVVITVSNLFTTVIMELSREKSPKVGQVLASAAKNPLIIASILGVGCKLLRFPLPQTLHLVLTNLGGVTTTVCFLALGVGLSMGEARANRRPLLAGSLIRAVLIPVVLLPPAALLGFRGQELFALVLLFTSPAAVTSCALASAYDADIPLAGQLVCLTTLLSIPVIFFWIFVFTLPGLL